MKSDKIKATSAKSDHGQHLVTEMTDEMTGLYEVEGKDKYHVYSTDPYGLWHIEYKGKGKKPAKLDSAFTSQTEAFKAIESYENSLR